MRYEQVFKADGLWRRWDRVIWIETTKPGPYSAGGVTVGLLDLDETVMLDGSWIEAEAVRAWNAALRDGRR